MTIATKAELRAALNGYEGFLHATYTDARLDELILMGESRINRELRLIDMITSATGSLSTSVATLALPARYLEKVQFRLDDPLTELEYVDPSQVKEFVCDLDTSRQPKRYTVRDAFEFDAVPDAAYAYTLTYYRGYRLSEDADTNYILANFPQAYLYAVAIDAALANRDWDDVRGMTAALRAELSSINRAEARRKGSSDARLRTEFWSRPSFNIDQG